MSSSSILSSPPPTNPMDIDKFSPVNHYQSMQDMTPTHLSSRTRKRYRDNRPSEATIHQHTLSILFSAQSNPQASPTPSQAPAIVSSHVSTRQSSLHSFWTLPARSSSCESASASGASSPTMNIYQATNCEDCNTSFVPIGGNEMDVDMDNTYGSGSDHACSACSKQVCDQCSVSNLGSQRQCLICAGKRRWVGGLGWVDQD